MRERRKEGGLAGILRKHVINDTQFIFDPADDKLYTGTGGLRGRKVAHKSHARDAASAPAPQIRHTLAQVPEVRIRIRALNGRNANMILSLGIIF